MPEYGQPIYNNLHWKSTLDFFKNKKEEEEADDPWKDFLDTEYAQMKRTRNADREATLSAEPKNVKEYEPTPPMVQDANTGTHKPSKEIGMEYQLPPRTKRDDDLESELLNSVEKNEGEGAFDESVPMPSPSFTGKDHPEGPGVPLKNGFTEKEKRQLARDDRRISSPSYPQDPDAKPTLYQGIGEPYVRPSRARHAEEERRQAKKTIEKSLLKLMKAHEKPIFRGATRTAGQRGPFDSEEPMTFRPMPNAQGNIPLLPEEIAGDRGSSPTAGERAETTLGRRPTAMPPEMVDAARKVSARQLAYEASPEGLREDPRMRSRPPGVEPHPEEVGMYDKRKIARAAQERAAKEADPSLYNKESSVEKSLLKLMKDGSIDKDDDDMGAKKPGIKQPPSSPKNRPYGNPSPPPVQPKTEEKKSVDVEKLDVPGAIKGGIRGLRGKRHPLLETGIGIFDPSRRERDLRRGDYGDEMRGEDAGRAIRNLPASAAERAHFEMNPEMLGDAARAGGRSAGRAVRGGREVARRIGEAERDALGGAKEGFRFRDESREDITPPIGEHPEGRGAYNVGERVGYGVGRTANVAGEAAQRFLQPESAYNPPDRPGLMDAHARQDWQGRQASQDIAARNPSRAGKGPMELSRLEKTLIKLMKDGDTPELNPMEDLPKENEESQALVADGDSKRPKSEVGTNDKMFKKEHERTPEEEKEIYVQRQINQRNAPGEHPEMSDTQRLIAQILQQKEEDAKQKATRLAPPGTVYSSRGGEHGDEDYDGPIEKALLKLMKEEISSRVQKLPPGMKPSTDRDERKIDVGTMTTYVPSYKNPGIKTTRPVHLKITPSPEKGESKEDWINRVLGDTRGYAGLDWKPGEGPKSLGSKGSQFMENLKEEHDKYPRRGDEDREEDSWGLPDIEEALLKLMKGGEISPAKVGMPRRAAIQPIENAFPAQAPKAPKGVGVSTATAPPPRSALETETSRPDTDQAGQTANWSAQMFAGDLAGKINRRFGTGKQDAIDAQRQAWETQVASQEKYPDLARQADNARNKPYGDTTSQGFGDSGVQQQQEFQRQTGIMGNQGRPVPSSLLSSTKK